ncbi:multi antimicrobial extrusion protein MatE [Paenibacillus koleovorans]|uniref:multi antimicrobial extrusion protein MatE n=1 Tax=Paenibacillus koleovorans TaxID=121608 RepID=UPI001FE7B7A4|nr:multi antimicrobial extrusion protein MatE [Paenibacillus koleovorans]
MKQLLAFFIPLGLSSSLVTISHVIINSTLARSTDPETIIASYSIGLSMLGIIERPAILLRQTCSALVRDKISFRAMSGLSGYMILAMFVCGLILSYTSVGEWIFLYGFGVKQELLQRILDVYRILMFVAVFSAIRCLYHGIIISNMRTKWLTIGMLVRLAVMYGLSVYYIQADRVDSGVVGAIIFLAGMIVEALVSYLEGRKVAKSLPEKLQDHPVERKSHIFQFYRPLLLSSLLVILVGPFINAMLGKTSNFELAVASFAIAASLTQLVNSFFSYMHMIVINFYKKDPSFVLRFAILFGTIPAILIGLLGYTPAGPWFMSQIMGVNERLMHESLYALRIFMLLSFIYPWVDFCNGVVLMRGQTKIMLFSMSANIAVTLVTLIACIMTVPHWNGMVGSLAQSLGLAAELGVLLTVLRLTAKSEARNMTSVS